MGGGTITEKLLKTLTSNSEDGKMSLKSERPDNNLIQIHQNLIQRKNNNNKIHREKDTSGGNGGSPLGKGNNDGRRVSAS